MASRRYENFDLLIESAGDGTFRSRVAASPVGAGASAVSNRRALTGASFPEASSSSSVMTCSPAFAPRDK